MATAKILGDVKAIDKDVELLRTTSKHASGQAAELLMEYRIPFTRTWKRVPFLKRRQYHGAKQVCVIQTNRSRYGQARRTLDLLGEAFHSKIIVSNY